MPRGDEVCGHRRARLARAGRTDPTRTLPLFPLPATRPCGAADPPNAYRTRWLRSAPSTVRARPSERARGARRGACGGAPGQRRRASTGELEGQCAPGLHGERAEARAACRRASGGSGVRKGHARDRGRGGAPRAPCAARRGAARRASLRGSSRLSFVFYVSVCARLSLCSRVRFMCRPARRRWPRSGSSASRCAPSPPCVCRRGRGGACRVDTPQGVDFRPAGLTLAARSTFGRCSLKMTC
jgi:hypothetical protein